MKICKEENKEMKFEKHKKKNRRFFPLLFSSQFLGETNGHGMVHRLTTLAPLPAVWQKNRPLQPGAVPFVRSPKCRKTKHRNSTYQHQTVDTNNFSDLTRA
jgi:hypothetical protein